MLEKLLPYLDVAAEPAVMPGIAIFTVTYDSGGCRVKAAMALPEKRAGLLLANQEKNPGGASEKAEPLPALLYCRGGIRGVGRVRPERISQLAAFGYVVFAPHYRGNEGGEGRDEFGGAEREDVYAAFKLLSALPFIDREKISLYGFSRGGMMALFAAMECRGVRNAVVWGGVSDLLLTYEERIDLRRMLRRVVGHPKKNREAYIERSPLYRAAEIKCPILIIHGTEDQNVSVEHARRLAAALQANHKPYEMWLAEGASHIFKPEEIEQYTKDMFAWMGGNSPVRRGSVVAAKKE